MTSLSGNLRAFIVVIDRHWPWDRTSFLYTILNSYNRQTVNIRWLCCLLIQIVSIAKPI
jgi:hypothetical protein